MTERQLGLVDIDAMIGPHQRLDVTTGTVDYFLSVMDRFGIAEAVVGHMHAWLHDPMPGNLRLMEMIAAQPRLRPCWVLLPDTCGEIPPPDDFARQAIDAGVVAVRACPQDHGYDLEGLDVAPVLDAVAEAGLPLLIDAEQTSLSAVEAVAKARPRWSVVVCRTRYRLLRRLAGVLARTDNVLIDLANMSSYNGLEWLVGRFGARRLLFGTGIPHYDPADVVTRLLWSELDDEAVAAIGSGNAASLLRARSLA